MKKLNEWLDKPITWKSSLIASLISVIISLIYYAFLFGWFKKLGEKIVDIFDDIKAKIKK